MDETVLQGAGAALAHARKTAMQVPPPWPEAPAGLEQAYALQRAAIAALGGGLAGWKIGATGKDHQARLKTDRPFFGPIPATDLHEADAQNGVALPFRPGTRGVECEIAFCMARALPSRKAPYGRDEVKAAVGSLHPALEVVGTRVAADGLPDVRLAIADYGLNMAFLPGAAVAGWHELDLSSIAARWCWATRSRPWCGWPTTARGSRPASGSARARSPASRRLPRDRWQKAISARSGG
ncbi:2-keto-4-pentenoate hydratase [Marinimicrococcus flavescens]|uniref:2-keto-4-pentenoate hydratase n=1 Tax=Marinimicrococcus flavescens TaxID=3031815 RepID=A0AAP3UZ18_9PROT|nr:hypothetical protein [Marinimicrococcus flavescens]